MVCFRDITHQVILLTRLQYLDVDLLYKIFMER